MLALVDGERAGRAAAGGTLGRRAAAAAAGAGVARPAAAAAAGRAADQPRSAHQRGGGRTGAAACSGARHHRAVQRARAQSAAAGARSGALSRRRRRPRSAPVDEVITGPVLSRALRLADRRAAGRRSHLRDVGRHVRLGRRACHDDHEPRTSMATATPARARCSTTISCVNAFAAAASSPCSPALVGYFLVLRGQTFAGHALSHVGFTGATGAVLIGVSPLWGMVGFTLAAGVGMGLLGERLARPRRRDRRRAVAVARLRPAVPAFLYRLCDARRRRCCSATCSASPRRRSWTLVGLGAASLRRARRRSRGRCCSRRCSRSWQKRRGCRCGCVAAVPGHRGARRRRLHADRRRAAGLHPDGRAGRGGAEPVAATRSRRRAGSRFLRWRKPGCGSPSPTTPIGRRASGSRRLPRSSTAQVCSRGARACFRSLRAFPRFGFRVRRAPRHVRPFASSPSQPKTGRSVPAPRLDFRAAQSDHSLS